MTINHFENIEEDYSIINSWKDALQFPFEMSSTAEKEFLKEITASEVSFQSSNRDKILFETAYDNLRTYLCEILRSLTLASYQFKAEPAKQLTNRVRTYKGIFPKGEDYFIQNEFLIEGDYSIISGISKLNLDCGNLDFDSFLSSSSGFIISTNKSGFYSNDTLKHVSTICMKHKDMSVLNYIKLISEYCTGNDVIFRVGGDGGVSYVSLQLFYNRGFRHIIRDTLM